MRIPNYGFIIATDRYTGNFEREICAYITGGRSNCGVGDEYAKMFEKEEGELDLPLFYMNQNGCERPVEMCDDDSNSLMIFFESRPTENQITLMKKRAKIFGNMKRKYDKNKMLEFKLEKYSIVTEKIKI